MNESQRRKSASPLKKYLAAVMILEVRLTVRMRYKRVKLTNPSVVGIVTVDSTS